MRVFCSSDESKREICKGVRQRSKLTFSKGCLLATFNCKMVAIKNIQSPKRKKTLHDILHVDKKGKTLHDIVHEGLMRRTACFQHFTFATVSLRIHVEFLNYER